MHALSVVTRAGELIVSGRKTLEIRSWRPDTLPLLDLAIVQNKRRLTRSDPYDPDGQIVAVVDIHRIRDWLPEDAAASCSQWEPGWLAWELENIRIVANAPSAPAKRRIYHIESRLVDFSFK